MTAPSAIQRAGDVKRLNLEWRQAYIYVNIYVRAHACMYAQRYTRDMHQ